MSSAARPFKITAGNAITMTMNWYDSDGLPDVPSSVKYQCFDFMLGVPIDTSAIISGLGSTMQVVIPASKLPGPVDPSTDDRRIVIQVEAEYGSGDNSVVLRHVQVTRRFAFT